jgi:hypothetical protein
LPPKLKPVLMRPFAPTREPREDAAFCDDKQFACAVVYFVNASAEHSVAVYDVARDGDILVAVASRIGVDLRDCFALRAGRSESVMAKIIERKIICVVNS